jgi:Peptidase A4 family
MSLRAQPGRLLAIAVVGVAVAVGAWSVPALGAAGGTGRAAPAGPSPAGQASDRAAATRALQRVFLTSGPLPFEHAPGSRARRVGGVTIDLSGNWSGYADDNSTGRTYSAVTATWVEPRVTCTRSEDELAGYWVGLDGLTDPTVEQDGTFAWCYQGAAYYYSWWEMYPNGSVVVGTTVAPGDRITASVTVTSKGYRLALADRSHPANSFTTVQQCPSGATCSNASAEWIAETPAGSRGLWPWPPFGTWRPSSAQATSGGKAGGIKSFPDDQIVIVGNDGQALASTGSLASSGHTFSLTWAYAY